MHSYTSISKSVKGPLDTRVTTDRSSDGTLGVWLWLGDLVSVWLTEADAHELAYRLNEGLDELDVIAAALPEDELVVV